MQLQLVELLELFVNLRFCDVAVVAVGAVPAAHSEKA